MGPTGTGKTSVSHRHFFFSLVLIFIFQFVNLLSGSSLRVGSQLESCTNEVQLSRSFMLDGQTIAFIDTPGFDDTNSSDTNILNMIAAYLSCSYVCCFHVTFKPLRVLD